MGVGARLGVATAVARPVFGGDRCRHRRARVTDLVGELVHEDAVPERDVPHVRAGAAVHRQPAAVLRDHFDRTLGRARLLRQEDSEPRGVRAADRDPGPQPGPGEVGDVLVRHHFALVERDDAVGDPGRLPGVVGGEKDRATERGVLPEGAVQPPALPGGEAGRGVVEHQRVRVGEQCAGQAEPSVHAARQGAQAFLSQAHEAHHLEHVVRASHRHTGRGAEHAQVSTDGPGRMAGNVTEQYADFPRGMSDAVQRATSEVGDATALLEFEHQAYSCRLARPPCAEQGGDTAGARVEGHVVDRGRAPLACVTRQSGGLDHRFSRRMGDRSAAGVRPQAGRRANPSGTSAR